MSETSPEQIQQSPETVESLVQDTQTQLGSLQEEIFSEQENLLLEQSEQQETQEVSQSITESRQEQQELRQDIEKTHNPNPKALEIIKQSGLYTKLQETFQDATIYPDLNGNIDAKIDRFSNKIDITITKYLESVFLPIGEKQFPPSALSSINTGIQFMLMDTLKNSNNNSDFFSSFASINIDGGFKNLFQGALGTFAKGGEFLNTGKRITKTIDFLSLHPSLRDNAHKIPQLMNPYQFILLANHPQIFSSKNLSTLNLTSVGIQEGDINMTAEQKEHLQSIANNAALKNDPKTIKAMISSLEKADGFLEKRKDLAQSALDLMDQADGMLKPFEKLLGIDMFEMLKPFKGVLNIVLSLLGFSGGLDGLQKRRLNNRIQKQLDTQDKKDFMKNSINHFKNNISTFAIGESDPNSTISKFGLTGAPSEVKSKIPLSYKLLEDSIKNNLSNPEIINPVVLQEMGGIRNNYILESTDSNGNTIIKGKESEFVQNYLNINIPKLVRNQKFMESIGSQDEFNLVLFGGIIVDQKNMIDGVKTKVISPSQYLTSNPSQPIDTSQTTADIAIEDIQETDPDLIELEQGPDINYAETPKFVQYLHNLEKQNALPYGIILNLMKQESSGRLYKDGEIITSSAGAKGLFQFMPNTAKEYIKKLGYPESDFEKIFTNPIIGAKACAQYLKDCLGRGDNLMNMLAHYNAGPNVLGGQKIDQSNFKNLPNETQKYVIKIGKNILNYTNNPIAIDAENISSINQDQLANFFVELESVPFANVLSQDIYLA